MKKDPCDTCELNVCINCKSYNTGLKVIDKNKSIDDKNKNKNKNKKLN